jgi:hypothetical protein
MNTQKKESDFNAIYEAVSDYYNGWYEADPERMMRCLHPHLAKRALTMDDAGKEYLLHLTKEVMVDATARGGGSAAPLEKRHWTITILDSYEEIAIVKVASGEYMEYIHLVKQDGLWLIVNVLYTDTRPLQPAENLMT